jgi:DNA repair exonuclease SbcCD ATPase subunit
MSATKQLPLTDPNVEWVAAGPSIACIDCGVVFWMTKQQNDRRLDDHKNFWCPNGHGQRYIVETEAEKYKRWYKHAEDSAAAARAERDQAEASRRAWKGQTTRLRKRALDGECPICGQHLRDVARHVARQHSGETPEIAQP